MPRHTQNSLIRSLIGHTLICIRSGLANTAGAAADSCQKGEEDREKTDTFLSQSAQIRHRGLFQGPGTGMPGGQHIVEKIQTW